MGIDRRYRLHRRPEVDGYQGKRETPAESAFRGEQGRSQVQLGNEGTE